MSFGTGAVNGHEAFGVNWLGVGCFSANASVANYFQLILIDRSDLAPGDFDIEFNYGPLIWDSGQASGGDAQCLGGTAAGQGTRADSGSPTNYRALVSTAPSWTPIRSPACPTMARAAPSWGVTCSLSRWAIQPHQVSWLSATPTAPVSGRLIRTSRETHAINSLAWPFLMSDEYPAVPVVEDSGFFACSGDTTTQLENGGSGRSNQITQLDDWVQDNGSPGLVTVTIGGDDLHFSDVLKNCYIDTPTCLLEIDNRISYLESGNFTPVLEKAYKDIKQAAAGGTVVAVGYPFLFPTDDFIDADWHCPWLRGDASTILPKFELGQLELDQAMQTAADEAGVDFIPLDDAPLGGHEALHG